MKRYTSVFLASLSGLLLVAMLSQAQNGSSLVFGSVLLQSSNDMIELSGVTIELYQDRVKVKDTRASPRGKFLFKDLPHGTYTLKIKNNNDVYYSFEDGRSVLEREISIANQRTNLSETIVYQAI